MISFTNIVAILRPPGSVRKYGLAALLCLLTGWAQAAANAIEVINAARQGEQIIVRIDFASEPMELPKSFSTTTPARVILDFPETANRLGSNLKELNEGNLRNINVVEADGRTRLVLNLNRSMNHSARLEGKTVFITLLPQGGATLPSGATTINKPLAVNTPEASGLREVNFRRGKDGEGRVTIDLSDSNISVDVKPQGNGLQVDFLNTAVPEKLRRRLDVTDFATPVTSVNTTAQGKNVRIQIAAKGNWEHSAYQTDNQLIIEVKPVVEKPNQLTQGSKMGFQGERVSINYQNGDVRSLLRLMAEELKLNAVISESVTGNITLVLKDVPADQVMAIIFQQRGLDMRKNGNVMLIGPRDELATREKLEFEQQQQLSDLEPLKTESFQINYQKAAAIGTLLGDEKQRILSKRGSAVVDARTNILFVQDTADKLEAVRALVSKIDVPVRQVMIEARIVEASDNFAFNLGARLGLNQAISGSNSMVVGGNLAATGYRTLQVSDVPTFDKSWSVNLPASPRAGTAGALSFVLYNATRSLFLNAEISALQADGKGKVISSPRVVTADQVEALIEQGVEIPYQQATSSGATSISFRKANLSLKVKPQITPDGKITMSLDVNKDSANTSLTSGAGIAIDTRHIKTEVLVDNGGTVVIGGIYTQTTKNTVQKVPLLGDIPILGHLFKTKEEIDDKAELLVFITPRIITEGMNLR
jgi:type IV pilus assembly protein PilQ